MNTKKQKYWKEYWSDKENGQHRSPDEAFLKKEAEEKLLLLSGGKSLLDFGCGSAELLTYYAQHYDRIVGADWSVSMINNAKKRTDHFGLSNKVQLIVSDDVHIWNFLQKEDQSTCFFDRITAGQVIQYFDKQQINDFINHAIKHLSKEGKICLFDIVDSRTYELWQAGLFGKRNLDLSTLIMVVLKRLKKRINSLAGIYEQNSIGYSYSPTLFEEIAHKQNMHVTFIHSMYYEYRFHAVFHKKTEPTPEINPPFPSASFSTMIDKSGKT